MFFELTNSDVELLTDYDKNGRYCMHLSKKHPNWMYRLIDFIEYHKENNITVEYNVSKEDIALAKLFYKNTKYDGPLRTYESKVFVHTIQETSWTKIQESMTLKSWNLATDDNDLKEEKPIGDMLKDPIRFRDYIMLGGMTYHNEIIILSKQLGILTYDKDRIYNPGTRIYLDAEKLANKGLLIRDGLHLMVKDKIDLKEYMIGYVTKEDLKLEEYTPFIFATEANNLFLNRIANHNSDC